MNILKKCSHRGLVMSLDLPEAKKFKKSMTELYITSNHPGSEDPRFGGKGVGVGSG